MRHFLIAAFTVLVLSVSVQAAEGWSLKEKRDNFQLYVNKCDPIGIDVYFTGEKGIRLTKESIETAARSRLRAAHLYGSKPGPVSGILLISVVVARWDEPVFHYRIWFTKQQLDKMSQLTSWSPTGWTRGALIVGSSDALSAISQSLDSFLDDFLRVNDCICDPARLFSPKPRLGCPMPYDPFDEANNRL